MKSPWLFTQNSTPRLACPHEQITLANDDVPTLSCRSCGKRWTFVPAGEIPRYCPEDDPTYPGMLDDRDWSKSARVAMTADDDSCTARGVELESELENLRALALALYAGIKLSPKLLEVRRRLIDERYAKRAAEAAEEFAARWKTAQRADGAIVRCRLCGFETFPFDHATIEKHWQTCGPEVLPGAAEAAEEFAARWKTAQRADGAIVRCRLCGFEALPLDHVTIEKHMQACRPEVLPGDQRS